MLRILLSGMMSVISIVFQWILLMEGKIIYWAMRESLVLLLRCISISGVITLFIIFAIILWASLQTTPHSKYANSQGPPAEQSHQVYEEEYSPNCVLSRSYGNNNKEQVETYAPLPQECLIEMVTADKSNSKVNFAYKTVSNSETHIFKSHECWENRDAMKRAGAISNYIRPYELETANLDAIYAGEDRQMYSPNALRERIQMKQVINKSLEDIITKAIKGISTETNKNMIKSNPKPAETQKRLQPVQNRNKVVPNQVITPIRNKHQITTDCTAQPIGKKLTAQAGAMPAKDNVPNAPVIDNQSDNKSKKMNLYSAATVNDIRRVVVKLASGLDVPIPAHIMTATEKLPLDKQPDARPSQIEVDKSKKTIVESVTKQPTKSKTAKDELVPGKQMAIVEKLAPKDRLDPREFANKPTKNNTAKTLTFSPWMTEEPLSTDKEVDKIGKKLPMQEEMSTVTKLKFFENVRNLAVNAFKPDINSVQMTIDEQIG